VDLGNAIIIGSGLFATAAIIIKWISVKNTVTPGGIGGNGLVSRNTMDHTLDRRLIGVVDIQACNARHDSLEKQISKIDKTQDKILERVEDLRKDFYKRHG